MISRTFISKSTALVILALLVGVIAETSARRIRRPIDPPIKSTNRLTFLGSFDYTENHGGIGTQASGTQGTSFYFMSQTATGHAAAESDCKAFLSDDATLLNIETLEELGNVTAELRKSDNTASSFWTGGKYDSSARALTWGNGVPLGPWAPWDAGHPSTSLPVTRVALQYNSNIKFRTAFNTVSYRYICELKISEDEEDADPCYRDNDLVIVVDSSSSISLSDYMIGLEFTARLATAWVDNPQNRIAVVIFSSTVQTLIRLDQTLSVSQLRETIYKAPYLGEATASYLGIGSALAQFQQNPRNVPRNMVFLTDGGSNEPQLTIDAAQSLIGAGIRSFSVGIGSGINAAELDIIAGGNQNRVFNTDGFSDLLKLLQPVSRRVCAA